MGQRSIQFLAAQPLLDQGGRFHGRTACRPLPAVVAYFDAEGPPLAAEPAVPKIFDPGRRKWSAIGPDRLFRQGPGELYGMVHQVPAHLVGAIGNALRPGLALGNQEQAGRLYGMGRAQEEPGARHTLATVPTSDADGCYPT